MITNLSANNSPSAIRRYRDGWERAFGPTRIKVTVREVPTPPMDDLDAHICNILDDQEFKESYTKDLDND